MNKKPSTQRLKIVFHKPATRCSTKIPFSKCDFNDTTSFVHGVLEKKRKNRKEYKYKYTHEKKEKRTEMSVMLEQITGDAHDHANVKDGFETESCFFFFESE